MEENSGQAWALPLWGGTILGAFRYIGAIPRKCKSIEMQSGCQSAVTLVGLLTTLLSLYTGWDNEFRYILKNPKDFGKTPSVFRFIGHCVSIVLVPLKPSLFREGCGYCSSICGSLRCWIIYLFIRYFKKPSLPELYCVAPAMIGTVCIISAKGLNLSAFNGDALFWGLISA